MQLIREEIWDFKHWFDLQIADFSDAREDYYGLRGGYIALRQIDTSRYDQDFGKPTVARVKDLAIEIGQTDTRILTEVKSRLSRFPHLYRPIRPDPRFVPMDYGSPDTADIKSKDYAGVTPRPMQDFAPVYPKDFKDTGVS